MEYITLNDELRLSRIIQGFWRLTEWKWTAPELLDFMHRCSELGVDSFDTAEIYGGTECEAQMGQALALDKEFSNKIKIVTKTGISRSKDGKFGYYDTTYSRILASCEASLKRLGREYIDLYLIHREDPCLNPWEVADALIELKKKGWIRSAGVSNFDPFKFDALNTALHKNLVTNQIEWNPVCYEHFNSGMMDVLLKEKVAPMIWSPLAGGRIFTENGPAYDGVRAVLEQLAQKYNETPATLVYAWLMHHPVKAMPISGSGKLERLQEAVRAVDVSLEHEDWYRLYTASGQQVLR